MDLETIIKKEFRMPLSNVQTGLNLWNAIQTVNKVALENCLDPDFSASLINSMNGSDSKMKMIRQEMIEMSLRVGKSIDAIENIEFEYGFEIWGKQDKKQKVVYYDQKLVFTSTMPMQITNNELPHSKRIE